MVGPQQVATSLKPDWTEPLGSGGLWGLCRGRRSDGRRVRRWAVMATWWCLALPIRRRWQVLRRQWE